MGNCSGRVSGEKSVKIVGSEGDLKLVPAPVTAAEVMLDNPGYAVAPVGGLRLTRRVTAVKADEGLVSGEAYILVPVQRVGGVISDVQLAAVERTIFGGGKRATRRRRRLGGSKVLPEMVGDEKSFEGVEGFSGEKSAAGGGFRRWGNGRPWTPVLEPILEGC